MSPRCVSLDARRLFPKLCNINVPFISVREFPLPILNVVVAGDWFIELASRLSTLAILFPHTSNTLFRKEYLNGGSLLPVLINTWSGAAVVATKFAVDLKPAPISIPKFSSDLIMMFLLVENEPLLKLYAG